MVVLGLAVFLTFSSLAFVSDLAIADSEPLYPCCAVPQLESSICLLAEGL
jgi:hypothetical protein